MDPELHEYLAASRRLKPLSAASGGDDYYNDLYEHLQEGHAEHFPPLTVINSAERSCEMVKTGGTWHLLYDQSLGDAFNLLTRILHHAEGPNYAEAFALKCVAQKLVSRGRFSEAFYVTLYCVSMQPQWVLPQISDRTDLYQFTAAQELFVIAHEVSHHLLKENGMFRRSLLGKAETVFGQARDRLSHHNIPQLDERARIHREYGLPIQQKVWKKAARSNSRRWNKYRDTYLDEIACDLFAQDAVIAYMNRHKHETWRGFKAAFLSLRYLRILHYCHAIADGIVAGGPFVFLRPKGDIVRMREEILRRDFIEKLNIHPETGLEYDRMVSPDGQEAVKVLTKQFAERLHDPIYFRLPHLMELMRKDLDIRNAGTEDGKPLEANAVIDLVDELDELTMSNTWRV